MKEYKHFRMEALVAKRDVVPAYDEVVFEGDTTKLVSKFTSWRTDVVQAIASAAELPKLSEDEEMIIVVRLVTDEDEN